MKENNFLDEGLDYLENHSSYNNLIEPEFVPHPKVQKQLEKQETLDNLNTFIKNIDNLLDPEYDFTDIKIEQKVTECIKEDGGLALKNLGDEMQVVYNRMTGNKRMLNSIKDKKFQAYLESRGKLNELLARIKESKNPAYNYLVPSIHKQLRDLDQYIVAYLVDLTFRSSEQNVFDYIKKRLASRRK